MNNLFFQVDVQLEIILHPTAPTLSLNRQRGRECRGGTGKQFVFRVSRFPSRPPPQHPENAETRNFASLQPNQRTGNYITTEVSQSRRRTGGTPVPKSRRRTGGTPVPKPQAKEKILTPQSPAQKQPAYRPKPPASPATSAPKPAPTHATAPSAAP
jgi:hypothetical protein